MQVSLVTFTHLLKDLGYFVMTNLTLIVDQIKNEISVDATGRGKASIRAVARLMDIDHAGLLSNFKDGEQNPSKLAQMLTEYGFDGGEQISWSQTGIPDTAIAVIAKYYAYKAGRYRKKQAELVDTAFTGIGVRSWMQKAIGWTEKVESKTTDDLTANELSDLADLIYGGTGMNPLLIAGHKASLIGSQIPRLKSATEAIKKNLSIPTKHRLVYPGELARLLAERSGDEIPMSSQAMNKLLAEKGLQTKNLSGKPPSWLLTDEGKEYGEMVMDTAKNHSKTVQSVKWKTSVLDLF